MKRVSGGATRRHGRALACHLGEGVLALLVVRAEGVHDVVEDLDAGGHADGAQLGALRRRRRSIRTDGRRPVFELAA
jgi:hypothetical protein